MRAVKSPVPEKTSLDSFEVHTSKHSREDNSRIESRIISEENLSEPLIEDREDLLKRIRKYVEDDNFHFDPEEPDNKIQEFLGSYCSRFEGCNAPFCPLDPWIRVRIEGSDPEHFKEDDSCGIARQTRHAYWASMPRFLQKFLSFEGYLEKELNRMKASRARWDALSEEEKNRRRSFLKKGKDPQ